MAWCWLLGGTIGLKQRKLVIHLLGTLFYFFYALSRLTYTAKQDPNQRIHSKVMTILTNCFFLPSPLASRRNESKEAGRGEKKGR